MENRFNVPVTVKSATAGPDRLLRSASEASDYLLNSWTSKRTIKHREAMQACHDVISGSKPAMTARRVFVSAAREAGLLVTDKA